MRHLDGTARNMTNHLAFGIAVTTVLMLCLGQFLGRYVLRYRMADDSVQIILFGAIAILKVPYRDIASVEILTFKSTLRPSLAWRFGNRLLTNDAVLIRNRKYALFYKIIITPDDSAMFVSEVNRRLTTDRR